MEMNHKHTGTPMHTHTHMRTATMHLNSSASASYTHTGTPVHAHTRTHTRTCAKAIVRVSFPASVNYKHTRTSTHKQHIISAVPLGVINHVVSFCLWWYVHLLNTYIDMYHIHLYWTCARVYLCFLCSCHCSYRNPSKMCENPKCQNCEKHVAHRGPCLGDNGWPRPGRRL